MKIEARDIARLKKLLNELSKYVDINHPVLVGGRKLVKKLEKEKGHQE